MHSHVLVYSLTLPMTLLDVGFASAANAVAVAEKINQIEINCKIFLLCASSVAWTYS